MSERLEEAEKWIGQMRLILSTKTDKDEIAYVQSKIDLFEWLIENIERFEVLAEQHDEALAQNNRYREALKKILNNRQVFYLTKDDLIASFYDIAREGLEE
ncbi:MAG TPA: hypothetical protein VK105_20395 [Virgibacillus sp.]|nr:hypothetical protein [Virgibacillus sp.]HLR69454.1 hypothetical protein [Virgibacillus sp.]